MNRYILVIFVYYRLRVGLTILHNKREILVQLRRHSVSEHHHVNENKCGDDNRTILSDKRQLIEYISHHHINNDSNHGRMCQHNSTSFVHHFRMGLYLFFIKDG